MSSEQTWPGAPGAESISPPLSTQDLRAFAGNAAYAGPFRQMVDYYVPLWVAALSTGAPTAGINWAAALFGANWCFWRKLYGLAVVILVAELVTSLLLTMIFVRGFGLEPDLATVNSIALLALLPVRALLARYANTLYLSKAIQSVAQARLQHATLEEQHALLLERGGTSWPVLVIALLVQLVLGWAPALPG